MKLVQRFRLTVLLAAIATTAVIVGAQSPAIPPNVAAAKLDDAVPVDPQITVGTLPNGLRYYIRPNRQPQGRAELRLAVNAGSVLEEEDQRGLAHFVEHMAFNGTLHFPRLDVVNFMQSLGMRFGAHVNANTSFDETIYELQIPTENPVVIDRALLANRAVGNVLLARAFWVPHENDLLFGPATGYGCCAANFHMGWPRLVQHLWLATRDGFVAPLFAPCTMTGAVRVSFGPGKTRIAPCRSRSTRSTPSLPAARRRSTTDANP